MEYNHKHQAHHAVMTKWPERYEALNRKLMRKLIQIGHG